jgi:hypothetical protein
MHVHKIGVGVLCEADVPAEEPTIDAVEVPGRLAAPGTPPLCNACMGVLGTLWVKGRQILPSPELPPEIAARLARPARKV